MQRWDLPSFDASPEGTALPSVDEVQNIHAKAHQEGFARGLQDGLAEGRAGEYERAGHKGEGDLTHGMVLPTAE